jgi:ATP-dependent protease ClpP protease subunit
MIRTPTAAALIFFAMTPTQSAEIGVVDTPDSHVIYIKGQIIRGDSDRFNSALNVALRKASKDKLPIIADLDSFGGSVSEAGKIASLVKEKELAVSVLKSSECASACFISFLSTPYKFAWYGARIGVHSVSVENGGENASTKEITVDFARYAKNSGAPDSIVGKLVGTKPNDIMFLSDAELKSMNVTFMDDEIDRKPFQTAAPLSQQQSQNSPSKIETTEPEKDTISPRHTIEPENWKSCAIGGMKDWDAIPEWAKAPHLRKMYEEPRVLVKHGLCNQKFKRIVLCLPDGAWNSGDKKIYTDQDWVCDAVMNKRK